MQSPCLQEASQVCFHGCCPTPHLGFPDSQKKMGKTKSTAATCRHNFAATASSSVFPNTQFTNPESLPSLQESFTEFSKAYPQYSDSYQADQIRAQEYCQLSLSHHTCLDYIGIGLFSYAQLQNHDCRKQIVSSSPPPKNSHFPFFSVSYKTGNLKTQLLHGGQESELESAIKKRIMSFLNISDNEYSMVFTANRTSAFKLVAESYPFRSSQKLLTVYDYESEAVETMIHCSEKKGAQVMSAEFSWPRLRIKSAQLKKMVIRKRKKKKKKKRGLFVFPLHSRVTGARYPYLWMNIAQENGWHILIDACALSPKDMDSFGLSLIRPDFLICSFYKIFGENPSGFGCLLVKKSTVPLLEDSTSAGMVNLIPAKKIFWFLDESCGSDAVEEQISKFEIEEDELDTSNSFSGPISIKKMERGETSQPQTEVTTGEAETCEVAASDEVLETSSEFQTTGTAAERKELETSTVSQQKTKKMSRNGNAEIECRGLDEVDLLGLNQISNRARCLTNWLVNALTKLKHPNTEEIPLIRIYGPKIRFDRGPALAFNVFDWKGEKVDAPLVQKLAGRSNISLSYGFLHHISFSDKYEKERATVLERRASGVNLGITVVTAALGFLANFEDTYRLWAFIAQFLDADFVEKAKWRYTALNQRTIEV